ncbi:hypothetical protein FKM82_011461 [Ascaphus truei]
MGIGMDMVRMEYRFLGQETDGTEGFGEGVYGASKGNTETVAVPAGSSQLRDQDPTNRRRRMLAMAGVKSQHPFTKGIKVWKKLSPR